MTTSSSQSISIVKAAGDQEPLVRGANTLILSKNYRTQYDTNFKNVSEDFTKAVLVYTRAVKKKINEAKKAGVRTLEIEELRKLPIILSGEVGPNDWNFKRMVAAIAFKAFVENDQVEPSMYLVLNDTFRTLFAAQKQLFCIGFNFLPRMIQDYSSGEGASKRCKELWTKDEGKGRLMGIAMLIDYNTYCGGLKEKPKEIVNFDEFCATILGDKAESMTSATITNLGWADAYTELDEASRKFLKDLTSREVGAKPRIKSAQRRTQSLIHQLMAKINSS